MSHHRIAGLVIAAAAVLDTLAGLLFAAAEHLSAGLGLYWAVTTATTVGYGDISPRTAAGHWLAAGVMLTVVPLFGATFSLFTSALAAGHVARSEERVKAHVSGQSPAPGPRPPAPPGPGSPSPVPGPQIIPARPHTAPAGRSAPPRRGQRR